MPDLEKDATLPDSGAPDRQSGDVGRTSGGGSLGHDQPGDVQRETPIRNAPDRDGRNATGSEDDPVMPQDDATLKTKI